MAPSLCIDLDAEQQAQLLAIARASIQAGLVNGNPLQLDDDFDPVLKRKSAVFVTLMRNGMLRGCIGSLEASEPLAQAVATASFNAAFRDRRFNRLEADEFESLDIEISILSEMEPIQADSRQALVEQLQPGRDGLLLEDGGRRATFLPKVWDKMASADEFMMHLLVKAGLARDHWSDTMRFHRYRTLNVREN